MVDEYLSDYERLQIETATGIPPSGSIFIDEGLSPMTLYPWSP
jgi:hypothetical protein